jgi:hypothetical protein
MQGKNGSFEVIGEWILHQVSPGALNAGKPEQQQD